MPIVPAHSHRSDVSKVSKAGDTMTGPLTVPTPTADGHAATKGYVDGLISLLAQRAGVDMPEIEEPQP